MGYGYYNEEGALRQIHANRKEREQMSEEWPAEEVDGASLVWNAYSVSILWDANVCWNGAFVLQWARNRQRVPYLAGHRPAV